MFNSKIILGSTSPRRKQLLEEINLQFEIVAPTGVEILSTNPNKSEAILELATIKNIEVQASLKDRLANEDLIIITADTMIVLDNQAIGKAKNEVQALEFLSQFSGKTHEVVTGHVIFDSKTGQFYSKSIASKVTFKKLTQQEIELYVESGEWKGKAGAYAGQGLGGQFITHFEGDYPAFVGISKAYIHEVLTIIKDQK
jgi:septum formation protein